jgi:hypothetical protein
MDKLIEVLREDRASQAAIVERLLAATETQAKLATEHLALLAAPAGPPQVRVMTDVDEALHERRRLAKSGTRADDMTGMQMIDPTALLADLERDFLRDSRHGR